MSRDEAGSETSGGELYVPSGGSLYTPCPELAYQVRRTRGQTEPQEMPVASDEHWFPPKERPDENIRLIEVAELLRLFYAPLTWRTQYFTAQMISALTNIPRTTQRKRLEKLAALNYIVRNKTTCSVIYTPVQDAHFRDYIISQCTR